MKKIVISCVNFTEGGPLSVIYDCLSSIQNNLDKYEVTVLVHSRELFKNYSEKINFLEYKSIKSSWFKRIYFEYFYSKKLSKRLNPDVWIALHDITPNVISPVQVVYCHNPSPFYKTKVSDFFTDRTFFLFSIFYRFLYRINIKRNKYVIVQQNWLRKEFQDTYHVKTIVAYPSLAKESINKVSKSITYNIDFSKHIFFFPAFPRTFKNFEVLFDAAIKLSEFRSDFEVIVTIDADQNSYAKKIIKLYNNHNFIIFIGKQKRENVFDLYSKVDCLIFPSKLETWGLPLSEFRSFNKPVLAANLPYAHEAVGSYDKVKFFDVNDPINLSNYMSQLIDRRLIFDHIEPIIPEQPFFTNWDDLLKFLIKISKNNSPNIL